MRIAWYISMLVLGVSIISLLVLRAITAIAPSWGSFAGSTPTWPGMVGFAAIYTLILSAAVLLTLGAVALIKSKTKLTV